MPKKRVPKYDIKPSSHAHPSLLSTSTKLKDAPRSLSTIGSSSGNSVNDQIQQLRLSQRPSSSSVDGRATSDVYNPSSNPSLPPSLRNILQIPDAPPPRPRPGLRVTGGRRGPAGPAAPQSWLRGNGQRVREQTSKVSGTREGVALHVRSLPDAYLPDDGSLVVTTLKALATHWEWHKEYDQFYLATIPVRYKEALLHYIAEYGEDGIDRSGLELLFQDESELEDGTGAEGLTHLDLANSIGRRLKFSDLTLLFAKKASAGPLDGNLDNTLESWNDSNSLQHGPSLKLFDNLTHLSLAHPSSLATWKGLLAFAPYLSTLTHLSLSHWPIPTLSPNSKTAYTVTPQGSVNYGASHFYSAYDQDWSEAASILRRFSKSTYCLQWLDLTGCHPWSQALASREIDWWGSWRALETVNIGQGWIPDCFQPGADERDWDRVYHGGDQEKMRLLRWAVIEHEGLQMEKKVDFWIGAGKGVRDFAENQDGGVVQDHHLQSWQVEEVVRDARSPERKAIRTERVRFERGWDAWWVKDAVEKLKRRAQMINL